MIDFAVRRNHVPKKLHIISKKLIRGANLVIFAVRNKNYMKKKFGVVIIMP